MAFGQHVTVVAPVKSKDDARGNADHLTERAEDTSQLRTPITAPGNDELLYPAPHEAIGRRIVPAASRVFGCRKLRLRVDCRIEVGT